MTISDETLMAFADGELQGAAREAVESAMIADPEVQRRVARHRALRARLREAYRDELTEPMPERLIMAARQAAAPPTGTVADLQDARDAAARRSMRAPARSRWRVGSIAASFLVGCGVGYLALQHPGSMMREEGGALVATGNLADVLTHRLGADQSADAEVRVGVSFLAKAGEYCRTFSTAGEQTASGLACRAGRGWKIQALIRSAAADPQSAGFRTASSSISPLILQLVDEQMAGDPLDQQGEDAARRRNWASDSR